MVVIATLASVASAQPATPNDKQKAQAGDLVKKAIAKSQAGDHGGAIDLYLQAYQIAPLPILLSNIGSEFQQQGKPVEALKYFCWYLKDDPTGANVTYATANVKALQIQLGHEVDDKEVCKPVEKKSEPVVVPPPAPLMPPEPAGGTTTPPVTGVAPIGGGPGGDQPSDVHRSTLQLAGLVVGGAGVVAFGIGTYYGIAGWQLSNKISSHSMTAMWETNIASEEAEGQSDNNKQIGFMIVGGVAAGAGAVMYYLGRNKPEDKEHVAIVPVGTPTSVGVVLSGGF